MKTIRYFFIFTVMCLASCGLQAQQQDTPAEAKNAALQTLNRKGAKAISLKDIDSVYFKAENNKCIHACEALIFFS